MSDSLAEDHADLREAVKEFRMFYPGADDTLWHVIRGSKDPDPRVSITGIRALLADRDRLAAQVEAVKVLHAPVTGHPDLDHPDYEATWCEVCGDTPCSTLRALEGES